jgi:hypothetical protein
MPTDDLNAATGDETRTAAATNTGGGGAEGAPTANGAAGQGAGDKTVDAGKAGEQGGVDKAAGTDKPEGDKGQADKGAAGKAKTAIDAAASGEEVDTKAADEAAAAKAAATPPAWKLTDEMRKAIAEHVAAGDKKAFERELKRLERIDDVRKLYGSYRELDNKLNGGGLVKVPGKDASPEEIAAYNKAIGVPEKPEGYLEGLTLENGAVIGEADKPLVEGFAGAMHKAGATPQAMKAALDWYYAHQAKIEADRADADDEAKQAIIATFREELGPAFRREMAALKSMFNEAPGGADDKNANSLYARMLLARTQDGKLLGNDPDFVRQLIAWRRDIRPFATVTEDGAGSAKSAEARLAELRALRKTDPRKYNSDAVQQEELRLIDSLQKAGVQVPAI